MPEFINMLDYSGGIDEAIAYYHSKWGRDGNYKFFENAIVNSSKGDSGLPRFYVLVEGGKIIGCCGLVTNDLISRHDLMPWLVGVYIEESERGRSLGNYMMEQAEFEAKRTGFKRLFLTTDLDGYYEKYCWTRMEDGYDPAGGPARIYYKDLK